MYKSILFLFILSLPSVAFSDCVYGAKNKTSFQVLSSNSILLTGGYGSNILIKTFCFAYSSSNISVLKDSFCSYESSVLYIDDKACDVNEVTSIDWKFLLGDLDNDHSIKN